MYFISFIKNILICMAYIHMSKLNKFILCFKIRSLLSQFRNGFYLCIYVRKNPTKLTCKSHLLLTYRNRPYDLISLAVINHKHFFTCGVFKFHFIISFCITFFKFCNKIFFISVLINESK